MNKNSLEERDNTLSTVDYAPLLKELLSVLKQQATAFHIQPQLLTIDLDQIALAAAHKLKDSNPPFTNLYGTQFATVNFADLTVIDEFSKLIERINTQIQAHLNTALKQNMAAIPLEQYISGLLTPATEFQNSSADKLSYPFNDIKTLHKRRLHLQTRKVSSSVEGARLKGHKLTISVKNTNDFDHDLIEGLCNRLEEVCQCSSKVIDITREVLKRRLTDSGSELSMLKRIVRRESLGRVQKEAKVRYLEFLSTAMEQWKGKDADGLRYLKNLAKRLRDLETFLKDESKDDGEYQVSYNGCGVNYRDLLSRADAFDTLPIITEIEGSLGETTNREKGEQIFTAGVKLKLNGHVQSKETVFDYYLSFLDPDDPSHQEQISELNVSRQRFAEKVLKIALLYYFVFRKMDDERYNPATDVERDLLTALRSGDEARQTQRLRWLKRGLSHPQSELDNQSAAAHGLKILKDALEAFIKLPHIGPDPMAYTLHLSVENGILDDDADRMLMEKEFFRTDILNEKGLGALKYISIQEADASGDGFCTLPITIDIEPLYYFSPANEQTRQFKMQYDVRGYQMLPVLFVPNDKNSQTICTQYYADYRRIVLHYHSRLPFKYETPEAFIYRFTFLLLSYISLKICADSLKKRMVEQHERLFLPLVRIHKNKRTDKDDHTNEESTISAFSKILSHMLAGENFSNAQGFHIDVLTNPRTGFMLTNGLSSLYTALPKTFALDNPPTLDKVAVILVSSRKSDAHYNSSTYIASIYGEVIGVRRYASGIVRVETLNTFSEYEDSSKMYRRPLAIRDQVKSCYEQGYRQILYIAQAPYTSALNITGTEKDEEQFFMSKEVIQALMDGRNDLKVYPLYCDKYYVVKVGPGAKVESLYVDDTSELKSLFSDLNRSSIVFFNLFNGYTVPPPKNQPDRTYYNGVISYATLVNIYDDPLYDQTIRNNLLDGSQPGSLKQDFLDFLTLLHFSRYEKNTNITFKLDPYKNIIGSESVGTLSLLPQHTINSVRFNALAFLTAVRKALNKHYIGYTPLPRPEDQAE